MRFLCRVSSLAFLVLFVAAFTARVGAQSFIRNRDVAVSAFDQSTSSVSGNGVTVKPTGSIGAQAAFRHSYHWWLGYEGSYDYARYSEHYSVTPFAIQNNMHEFGASYLVSGTSVLGFRLFALGGVSAVVFSPTLNGGQNVSWQAKPGLNFSVGVNHSLLTSHFGVRLQYRGVYYKAPDFNRATLDTGKSRLTSEPMVGVYLKF
ncbi:MAG TPA: hypothetical protein VFW25_09755 [Silvibacterium sp.]|nr:hypothetical protein [Silvibacterium sp.]